MARLRPVTAPTPGQPTRTGGARTAARAATTAAAAAGVLLASALPAYAVERSDGDSPGPGISKLEALGVYVGIPLGLYLLIALVVFAPAATRGPRYRPGQGYSAEPEWVKGPEAAGTAHAGAHGAPDASGAQGAHGKGTGGASATW